MNIVKVKSVNERVKIARKLILSAGNKFGVVHFIKRSDGSKRKMAYRLHVVKPQYVKSPSGKGNSKRKSIEAEKDIITVFDVNHINYDKKQKRYTGRGAYRSVPLDSVIRISVNGEITKFANA